jgi:Bromodomain
MDLEMIRTRLENHSSSDSYTSAIEFYRDLLLLCANALVFFPKSSEEHFAALHLRSLSTKQINSANHLRPHGSSSSSYKEVKLKDLSKPKADSDVGGPLLEKPAIIVCRKRSSLANAASANTVVEEEKKDKVPVFNPDPNLRKTSTRGPRTSKTRSNTTLLASSVKSQQSSDKSVATSENLPKKRNAADFLKRLKDSTTSTSSKVSHGETAKRGKSDGKREQGSSRKQTTPPGKRSVGRPPKSPTPSVTPPPAKRLKEEAAKPPPASKRRVRNR